MKKSFARHEVRRASLGMRKQTLDHSSDSIDVLPLLGGMEVSHWCQRLEVSDVRGFFLASGHLDQ